MMLPETTSVTAAVVGGAAGVGLGAVIGADPGAAAAGLSVLKSSSADRAATFFRSVAVHAVILLSTSVAAAELPTVTCTVAFTAESLVDPLSYRSPVVTVVTVTLASGMPRHCTAMASSRAVLFSVAIV